MAEGQLGEKQFEATESHIARAKREGDIARSQELVITAAFAGALIAVASAAAPLCAAARTALYAAAAGRPQTTNLLWIAAFAAVPMASGAVLAILAAAVQTGGLRASALRMQLSRLDLTQGVKRMVSRDAAIAAVRAIIAFGCASAVLIPACIAVFSAALNGHGVLRAASIAWSDSLRVSFVACVVGATFGGADFGTLYITTARENFTPAEVAAQPQAGDIFACTPGVTGRPPYLFGA